MTRLAAPSPRSKQPRGTTAHAALGALRRADGRGRGGYVGDASTIPRSGRIRAATGATALTCCRVDSVGTSFGVVVGGRADALGPLA